MPRGRNKYMKRIIPNNIWLALTTVVFACFTPIRVPEAFGVTPALDGGYPNGNTAEGTNALFSLTTGQDNTANGFQALFYNTTGDTNTATGGFALYDNTIGRYNTATGAE